MLISSYSRIALKHKVFCMIITQPQRHVPLASLYTELQSEFMQFPADSRRELGSLHYDCITQAGEGREGGAP